jgi:hypothetical protein
LGQRAAGGLHALQPEGLAQALREIVPIGASAMPSSKLVKGAALKVYPGAPHGMCSTLKDQVNADLLAFFNA